MPEILAQQSRVISHNVYDTPRPILGNVNASSTYDTPCSVLVNTSVYGTPPQRREGFAADHYMETPSVTSADIAQAWGDARQSTSNNKEFVSDISKTHRRTIPIYENMQGAHLQIALNEYAENGENLYQSPRSPVLVSMRSALVRENLSTQREKLAWLASRPLPEIPVFCAINSGEEPIYEELRFTIAASQCQKNELPPVLTCRNDVSYKIVGQIPRRTRWYDDEEQANEEVNASIEAAECMIAENSRMASIAITSNLPLSGERRISTASVVEETTSAYFPPATMLRNRLKQTRNDIKYLKQKISRLEKVDKTNDRHRTLEYRKNQLNTAKKNYKEDKEYYYQALQVNATTLRDKLDYAVFKVKNTLTQHIVNPVKNVWVRITGEHSQRATPTQVPLQQLISSSQIKIETLDATASGQGALLPESVRAQSETFQEQVNERTTQAIAQPERREVMQAAVRNLDNLIEKLDSVVQEEAQSRKVAENRDNLLDKLNSVPQQVMETKHAEEKAEKEAAQRKAEEKAEKEAAQRKAEEKAEKEAVRRQAEEKKQKQLDELKRQKEQVEAQKLKEEAERGNKALQEKMEAERKAEAGTWKERESAVVSIAYKR